MDRCECHNRGRQGPRVLLQYYVLYQNIEGYPSILYSSFFQPVYSGCLPFEVPKVDFLSGNNLNPALNSLMISFLATSFIAFSFYLRRWEIRGDQNEGLDVSNNTTK